MFENVDFTRNALTVTVAVVAMEEKEAVLQAAAEELMKRDPESFDWQRACVYYKLDYVPPCDRFQGLRQLILRVRGAAGLRADYRGVVAVEVSQWLGHEREEYFTAFLKYLADNAHTWRTVLVVEETPRLQKLLCAVAPYLTVRTQRLRVEPVAYMESILGVTLSEDSRALLEPLVENLSLGVLERVAQELEEDDLTEMGICRYLCREDSTLALLTGNRRFEYDKAI